MTVAATTRVVCVAGEASGDLLASLALPALRAEIPELAIAGIAGDRMIAAGVAPWWHVRELSVRGYAEVLRHLPRLLQLRSDLIRRAAAWQPAVYVGIDAPDLNLGIEARLRVHGIRTVQFIAPAVWAWRAGRITAVARAVDHLLAVFPFEQALFEKAGIRCSFVGHPLARAIPREPNAPAARARLKLSIDAPTLAVLPGSRRAEIEALGPPFVATIDALLRGDARLQVVVPAADETLGLRLAQMLDGLSQRARVHLLRGHSHDALEAADVALVAGGTATLEAMLFKRPMVIAYKVPPLTEWLTRRKALIPYFGLPNILAQRFIVPEYLQKDVTPRMLVPAVLRYFDSDQEVDGLRDRFAALHETLLRDTPALFAEAVSELARGGRAQSHY